MALGGGSGRWLWAVDSDSESEKEVARLSAAGCVKNTQSGGKSNLRNCCGWLCGGGCRHGSFIEKDLTRP